MVSLGVLVCSALIGLVAATDVDQCPGETFKDLSSSVDLTCTKIPCKLKKGTNQAIKIKFTPEKDLKEVKNHVLADVLGIPLPFIGVDGKNVCDKIETESGEKPGCPLKAGTTYVYKDSFPVERFYPSIRTRVHWALQANNKDVICFELPAQIKD